MSRGGPSSKSKKIQTRNDLPVIGVMNSVFAALVRPALASDSKNDCYLSLGSKGKHEAIKSVDPLKDDWAWGSEEEGFSEYFGSGQAVKHLAEIIRLSQILNHARKVDPLALLASMAIRLVPVGRVRNPHVFGWKK